MILGNLVRNMNDQRVKASPDTYKILVGQDEHITKLSEEVLERHIISCEFRTFHDKVTLCMIHMKNGFVATGTAGVVDPANFDEKIGAKVAKAKAMDKVWVGMGYQLQTELAMKRLELQNA